MNAVVFLWHPVGSIDDYEMEKLSNIFPHPPQVCIRISPTSRSSFNWGTLANSINLKHCFQRFIAGSPLATLASFLVAAFTFLSFFAWSSVIFSWLFLGIPVACRTAFGSRSTTYVLTLAPFTPSAILGYILVA